MEPLTANGAWLKALSDLRSPDYNVRSNSEIGLGQTDEPSVEIIGYTTVVNMHYPALTVLNRKLSYPFMFAEAEWMLSGRNDLESLKRFAPSFQKYSDDGITLSGAYGPEIQEQTSYVTRILCDNIYSRQAVIAIWKPNPKPSKDIPCTLVFQFLVRDGKLHLIVQMRSSDVWLGFPYDIFSFSMLTAGIILLLKNHDIILDLGNLYFRAGSFHLYHKNLDKSRACLDDHRSLHQEPFNVNMFKKSGDLLKFLDLSKERSFSEEHPKLW